MKLQRIQKVTAFHHSASLSLNARKQRKRQLRRLILSGRLLTQSHEPCLFDSMNRQKRYFKNKSFKQIAAYKWKLKCQQINRLFPKFRSILTTYIQL